jgi:ElaB/YqjD/DUF883 family membrane-anchored ribosome-binding protein
MNTNTDTLTKDGHKIIDKAHDMGTQAASKADEAIHSTQERAAQAEKSLHDGLKQVGEAVPATLARAATQAEELARAGIDRARAAGQTVAQQASHMREQTVSYVREEPTKALLMAVAAGAFATLLIGWATRGNGNSRH